jgi:UDP-N-acetylglucosamine 2-epimerase (non-hydrolysing)
MAAFYHRIPVGHVEAGLRTGDRWQPFPEEINRRIASAIADRHFAPTERSRQNLLRENVPDQTIVVTGNPGIDALRWITSQPENELVLDLLRQSPESRIILVTAHRRENFGSPLKNICLALREIAEHYAGSVRIVYPVHRNPNVWGPVHEVLGRTPFVTLRPPLDYFSNLQLMKRANLVVTDSGGIQEEATGLGIPALVLRDVTERPEGVETGALRLVGTDQSRIVNEVERLLDDQAEYSKMAQAVNPFGDGHAAERIVASLLADASDTPAEPTA